MGPYGICGSNLTKIGLKLTPMTHVGPLTLAMVHVGPNGICGFSLTEIGQKLIPMTNVGPITLA